MDDGAREDMRAQAGESASTSAVRTLSPTLQKTHRGLAAHACAPTRRLAKNCLTMSSSLSDTVCCDLVVHVPPLALVGGSHHANDAKFRASVLSGEAANTYMNNQGGSAVLPPRACSSRAACFPRPLMGETQVETCCVCLEGIRCRSSSNAADLAAATARFMIHSTKCVPPRNVTHRGRAAAAAGRSRPLARGSACSSWMSLPRKHSTRRPRRAPLAPGTCSGSADPAGSTPPGASRSPASRSASRTRRSSSTSTASGRSAVRRSLAPALRWRGGPPSPSPLFRRHQSEVVGSRPAPQRPAAQGTSSTCRALGERRTPGTSGKHARGEDTTGLSPPHTPSRPQQRSCGQPRTTSPPSAARPCAGARSAAASGRPPRCPSTASPSASPSPPPTPGCAACTARAPSTSRF